MSAPDEAARCPFIPPYPEPLRSKAGLLRRFWRGWNSWIHTLFVKSYTMKMGRVRLPRQDIFVVSDLDEVERIMADPEGRFPKHPILNDMLGDLMGGGVFLANGQDWADQRAMMNPAFGHTHLARAFPAMADAVDAMMAQLAGSGALVDVDPVMSHVTADIIFRTLFSRSLAKDEGAQVYAAFSRYQRQAQRSTMLGIYGLPRLGYKRRAKAAASAIHAIFEPMIRARLDARSGGASPAQPDILDALIDARHAETGAPFSPQALRDQVAILFLAGHETSASALSWALYLLAESPALQERLYADIIAVTDGKALAFEDLRALEGVRNLFRETLRLYPPVSFIPRGCAPGTQLRGVTPEQGAMLVISPWLIQRNPANWACPHAFDPGRFADPANSEAVRRAWLPFGKGERVCIGAGFAQAEAVLILARIICAYRLSVAPGFRPELVSRLTLRAANGMRLVLRAR